VTAADKLRSVREAFPYRERPITEDFYEHNSEWVYRWNDERWVLRAAAQEPPADGGDRG
jgi:hypothetical protein